MIPLYDDNPSRGIPVVVFALIAACVAVYLHQVNLHGAQLAKFLQDWAAIPQHLFRSPRTEWQTLISSQFLHANFWHLLGNMWFLWIFGNNVEEELGHGQFLVFYIFCGVVSAATQSFFSTSSTIPLIGASGAIAGVMGGYIVRFPRASILTLVPIFFFITAIRVPAAFFLGFWIIGQTVYAATTNPGQPGVAYLAHISGFVVGAILLKLIPKRY